MRELIEQRYKPMTDDSLHKIEFLFTCTLPPGAQHGIGHRPDANQVGVVWLPLSEVEQYQLYPLALHPPLKKPVAKGNGVYLGHLVFE